MSSKRARLLIFLVSILIVPGSAFAAMVWNSPPILPTAYVGMPYSYQLQVAGDVPPATYSIVSGNLLGLSLSSSGLISGTPTFRKTSMVTIRATDSTAAGLPQTAVQTFTLVIATGAVSDLHIQRLQIYFKNNRAEITVDKNDSPPRLFARLDYVGSGLLRGYWEVDGRVYSLVQQTLVYGTNLILEAAPTPGLPTYATGTHQVRLVITDPMQAITFPDAMYYVSESPEPVVVPIALLNPVDRGVVADGTIFTWQTQDNTAAYLVEFFNREQGRSIFAAYTRKAQYTIADHILSRLFAEKGSYFWRVTGFSSDNFVNNQSTLQSFHFQESITGVDQAR